MPATTTGRRFGGLAVAILDPRGARQSPSPLAPSAQYSGEVKLDRPGRSPLSRCRVLFAAEAGRAWRRGGRTGAGGRGGRLREPKVAADSWSICAARPSAKLHGLLTPLS